VVEFGISPVGETDIEHNDGNSEAVHFDDEVTGTYEDNEKGVTEKISGASDGTSVRTAVKKESDQTTTKATSEQAVKAKSEERRKQSIGEVGRSSQKPREINSSGVSGGTKPTAGAVEKAKEVEEQPVDVVHRTLGLWFTASSFKFLFRHHAEDLEDDTKEEDGLR
jgi:hypothetical protein